MPSGKLVRLVVSNTLRNKRHLVLSSFGVVVGIAAFVFFLALSMGVRNVVLGDIFPLERLEVIPPRATTGGGGEKIDDAVVERIRTRSEVVEAVPRMTMNFPALGRGYFKGNKINFEAGGFGDGVDPKFLADETFGELFQDWEVVNQGKQPEGCGPPPKYLCSDKLRYYCDRKERVCKHRVPVIISKKLLEIYNTQFADSHGLPQIGSDLAKFIVERGGYGKVKMYLYLGDTIVAGSNRDIKAPVQKVEAMLLGISDKAIDLGFTIPIGYVKRWNRIYASEEAATSYSSVVVTVRDANDVASFGSFIQKELDLRLEDSMGERFSLLILIVTALFLLISLVIVTISAINIAHNFFMQVMERRREIGLMRAIGATRADISAIVIGEASLIGVISGLFGIVVARLAGLAIDYLSNNYVGDYAFKPESYFDFQWWILAGGLGFSILFCMLGGFLPARQASRMAPAQALAQQ
ncbi:MAG: ABC transporter permease [Deltaproteobacteria bacterium]|nr:ABC transporter permease [Deltaproteobacteria bacterium]